MMKKRMEAEVTIISYVLRHDHCNTEVSLPVQNETVSYEATTQFRKLRSQIFGTKNVCQKT